MCGVLGYSRGGYYKRKKLEIKRRINEEQIIKLARAIKHRQPESGIRKLQKMLNRKGITIGRDRLFRIAKRNGFLVKRKKKYVRTTNSYHRFKIYKNLIKGKKIERPNQVYVADITYLETNEKFAYLSLLTDIYSKKIVGYNLSRDLAVEGNIKTLEMAAAKLSPKEELIHHSDRGIQYCSNVYVNELKKRNIKISMTEENHVYENAVAERVNGILKEEYLFGSKYLSFEETKILVDESIKIYNQERLHLSLNYKTPAEVHAA